MGSKPYVLKFHELHPCNFPLLLTKTIPFELVRAANVKGGMSFFSQDNTRYFKSRYPSAAYQVGNKAFFITSERSSLSTKRCYTVRVCDMTTGRINDVGKFCQNSEVQARKLLIDTIRQEEVI